LHAAKRLFEGRQRRDVWLEQEYGDQDGVDGQRGKLRLTAAGPGWIVFAVQGKPRFKLIYYLNIYS
jgi:hypothetical protein